MDDDIDAGGTLETPEEELNDGLGNVDPAAVVKLWTKALEISRKDSKKWREAAKKVRELFYQEGDAEKKTSFNILYSNITTILPAIYNSTPVPDVRRRFSDDDPDARVVAQVIERCISYCVDSSDFDFSMRSCVFDGALVGRGLTRLQYSPVMGVDPLTGMDMKIFDNIYFQEVDWDDFLHGPAYTWKSVPWVAYGHKMTRQQLLRLNPEVGADVGLNYTVEGYEAGSTRADNEGHDIFKRAYVWEIWDKNTGKVLFICENYKKGPLAVMDPPISVEGFFPTPQPFYYTMRTGGLQPIEPYRYYKSLAEELDTITKRLTKLVRVMKWRGVRAKALGDSFDKIKDLDDGELAPADNAMEVMQHQGGVDKGIWLMPIDRLTQVIAGLADQRERVKQTIYEVTGIADIMRGASKATETLGAQQIKTQWGTLKIQDVQAAVARYVRDFFRMMGEVIADKFDPNTLALMTGIQLTPEQVALLKNDLLRQYHIDIETDSTIRADLTRNQQAISTFLQGLAQFVTAVGPAVQSGIMPVPVAIEMLVSFSRPFKLGKQVEDVLDQWKMKIEGIGQQPMQQAQIVLNAGVQPTQQQAAQPPVNQNMPIMGRA